MSHLCTAFCRPAEPDTVPELSSIEVEELQKAFGEGVGGAWQRCCDKWAKDASTEDQTKAVGLQLAKILRQQKAAPFGYTPQNFKTAVDAALEQKDAGRVPT